MIRVAISGVDGNMGGLVAKNVLQDPDLKLVAGFTVSQSPNEGKDIGSFHGTDPIGTVITSGEHLTEILQSTKPDVYVDFTLAKAAEKNCLIVAENKIKCVIGTTALSPDFLQKFTELVKSKGTCAVISPNMSLGVNILFKLADNLTKLLSSYDIEIIEAHHHRKQDVPSGTAMQLAQIIASSLNKKLEDIGKFGRSKGITPRKLGADEIGIHAIRAGDIVGEHTLLYAGPGERIEVTHRAHSRQCFATGTLVAIKFLAQKGESTRIYSMQDVLGLTS
ncbi:MAG TPA: 4-hydroxy-tetrahydrodipicolinate reductase [Candidatus Deferrimicrobium sp.]|nr:4-hydroxy-tetrahydrodipicolinate reductase [Candidatus Deferrimicrobium sp.]